jgi:hypothetical protein
VAGGCFSFLVSPLFSLWVRFLRCFLFRGGSVSFFLNLFFGLVLAGMVLAASLVAYCWAGLMSLQGRLG